ncbi:LssY C-terminal domain-containing protein [Aurantimonas sp. HBX-1]|uniref:LssY C-terminal domain-containing protein n=1 Tax=Aurantimonas sp. HBX-1 TaxID=2906072 RepID=UPI001F18401A|nr:LssY C-terminal domain-containing protein [Aurantimonas sp. HBX-1]UIJ73931.1 LssY C-terminal domain-containing protein [Aurantimonas sp. HBX-1]
MQEPLTKRDRRPRRWARRAIITVLALVSVWAFAAYVLLPLAWARHDRQPGLADKEMVTRTGDGIAGDPLNVGLVGTQRDVVLAMHAAGWFAADPITFRSSVDIVGSVILDRPYPQAPVSPLYLARRREQLAFELPVGRSADRRLHVRLWQVLQKAEEGRPLWLGSVTYDAGVGFSHYTGAVTHRIAPDVDRARDDLAGDLASAGMVAVTYELPGVGPTLFGRNGEGDPYHTDGDIRVAVLVPDGERRSAPPEALANPPLIDLRSAIWRAVGEALAPNP